MNNSIPNRCIMTVVHMSIHPKTLSSRYRVPPTDPAILPQEITRFTGLHAFRHYGETNNLTIQHHQTAQSLTILGSEFHQARGSLRSGCGHGMKAFRRGRQAGVANVQFISDHLWHVIPLAIEWSEIVGRVVSATSVHRS